MGKFGVFLVLLLGALACDANVVDVVQEPPQEPLPAAPSPLESSLIHRYSFDGDATQVLDSKGAAHGQLVGSTLSGDGTLTLAGEHSGQYVNLPNGIVSGLGDATFEAWLTWNGGGAWQRIFDFGNSAAGEDMPGPTGTSYLFLTTASSPDPARMLPSALRVAYSQNGVEDEELCSAQGPFPSGVETHVAVVIDQAKQSMSLYQDGALLRECALTRPLSAIDDVNNWLGHSNYVADLDFAGVFDEFRVYGAALSQSELAHSFAAGPDAKR
jgi:hypothetical protein